MDEIEVEAVSEIDPPTGIDGPSCILYGGKGGVGKTTMAAATALASARDGTSTLVISTDPAHSLSDILDVDIASEPQRIDQNDPFWAVEIDPKSVMDGETGSAGIGAILGEGNPLAPLMQDAALPGSDEIVALQQVMTYIDDERFERLVIDTAPTGHTLRLLELPEIMDSLVGRLLTMRERMSGLFDGIPGMGAAEESTTGLTELSDELTSLRSVLTDPAITDFRVVLVPEMMSVDESNRLIDQLESADIPVRTVVVNRVLENPAAVVHGIADDELVTPDHEGCEFCRRRWNVQRTAIMETQAIFRGKTVKRVPLLADEVRGEHMLSLVARCLD